MEALSLRTTHARKYLAVSWLLVYFALGIILAALCLLTLALSSGGWGGLWGMDMVYGFYLLVFGIVRSLILALIAFVRQRLCFWLPSLFG